MQMSQHVRRTLAASVALMMTQAACFNTYFIEKDELEKLESSVEQREVVQVYGDCAGSGAEEAAPAEPAATSRNVRALDGTMWAQADTGKTATPAASDATTTGEAANERPGCVKIPVSTANTLTVVTTDEERLRVTPFNFIMDANQLVSPEYDLLRPLNEVKGAEVRQFSTWKTVATIVGVTVSTAGAFILISTLAGQESGFTQ